MSTCQFKQLCILFATSVGKPLKQNDCDDNHVTQEFGGKFIAGLTGTFSCDLRET